MQAMFRCSSLDTYTIVCSVYVYSVCIYIYPLRYRRWLWPMTMTMMWSSFKNQLQQTKTNCGFGEWACIVVRRSGTMWWDRGKHQKLMWVCLWVKCAIRSLQVLVFNFVTKHTQTRCTFFHVNTHYTHIRYFSWRFASFRNAAVVVLISHSLDSCLIFLRAFFSVAQGQHRRQSFDTHSTPVLQRPSCANRWRFKGTKNHLQKTSKCGLSDKRQTWNMIWPFSRSLAVLCEYSNLYVLFQFDQQAGA